MTSEGSTVRFGSERPKNFKPVYAVLRVIQGRETGREYPLSDPEYIIGRDSEADIYMPEEYVSRRHCARGGLKRRKPPTEDGK